MSVMGKLAAVKLMADIGEVASKIYATAVDKSRKSFEMEQRVKALEAEIASMKARGQ